MKRCCIFVLLTSTAWAANYFVSTTGSDSNNCLSSGAACLTITHAETLSVAGDTINIAAGLYRLSTSNSSTAGWISAKDNQTFIGAACSPKSGSAPAFTPCTSIISGGQSIGGAATGPDGNGDWSVTGQTQAGTVTAYGCDPVPYDGCNYPEDLFYDNSPLIHIKSVTRPTLVSGQWWFDYTNNIIYFHQTPSGHTVETSILQAMFQVNGANGVTIDSLTVKEFASPNQTAAITPANAPATPTSGINWTVQNSYITLNHGGGIESAFGLKALNNVVTINGQQGIGGGAPAGVSVTPSNEVIQGNIVTFNNFSHMDPGVGAGGMKWGNVAGIVIRGNTVTNNLGNGIHLDTNSVGGLIDGNDIENNQDTAGNLIGWGIIDEISQGGLIARNNYIKFIGAGGSFALVSSTSADMQAYCNVVESASTNTVMSVVGSDRGNRNNNPGNGTPFRSTGNYFHHNTLIWDAGATSHAGYFLTSAGALVQPNFFADNTPPNFNTYHLPSTASVFFYYDNNSSGSNTLKTFANYQASTGTPPTGTTTGPEPNGTIDTINTSGFPVVAVTVPADQAIVVSPVSVTTTASDGSGITKVEFYVDWVLTATDTTLPYNFTWSGGTLGPHTVAAMAYSTAGVRACNAVTVQVATAKPGVNGGFVMTGGTRLQ